MSVMKGTSVPKVSYTGTLIFPLTYPVLSASYMSPVENCAPNCAPLLA
jgi:hypothetical protein